MRRLLCLALVGLAATGLLGCSRGGNPGTDAKGGKSGGVDRLNVGGSTFVYPMMSKWGAEYKKAKGVGVNYNSTGSGAGIQQMIARTYDFGCSDAPMNEHQLKKAMDNGGDVVHIPLCMGA